MSVEELTGDDKQRLRRAAKSVKRKEKQMELREEKLIAKLNPGQGNKYEKRKALEQIRNDKRVILTSDSGKRKKVQDVSDDKGSKVNTSSTGLFKQLQEEAKHSIATMKKRGSKLTDNGSTEETSSKRVKLG